MAAAVRIEGGGPAPKHATTPPPRVLISAGGSRPPRADDRRSAGGSRTPPPAVGARRLITRSLRDHRTVPSRREWLPEPQRRALKVGLATSGFHRPTPDLVLEVGISGSTGCYVCPPGITQSAPGAVCARPASCYAKPWGSRTPPPRSYAKFRGVAPPPPRNPMSRRGVFPLDANRHCQWHHRHVDRESQMSIHAQGSANWWRGGPDPAG